MKIQDLLLRLDKITKFKNMNQIMYFTATWCGPCKAMAPIIADLQSKYQIQKIDVDLNPDLVAKHAVRQVPTFLVIKNGNEFNRTSGAKSKSQLETFFSS